MTFPPPFYYGVGDQTQALTHTGPVFNQATSPVLLVIFLLYGTGDGTWGFMHARKFYHGATWQWSGLSLLWE